MLPEQTAAAVAAGGSAAGHIVAEGLSKAFATAGHTVTALDNLSLTVTTGGVTGLVGPDGAGKTTLLRLFAGLLTPDSGTIRVAGLDPSRSGSLLRTRLGYMPQKFGLYEDLTVLENLNLFARLCSIAAEERQGVFNTLLNFTGLARFTARLAGKLSGGMKQKLGLACTLLGNPDVLLLDEPGVGVDPISRRELWKMVHTLADEGMLIVWSTSYLDEAEQCRDILLLNEGRIIFRGPPQNLTTRVSGRVFLVSSQQPHRTVLQHALTLNGVSDGVIEGSSIRLIFKESGTPKSVADVVKEASSVCAAQGRFEDAFIDLLGGITVRHSVLADIVPRIDCSAHKTVIEADRLTKKFGTFLATDQVGFSVRQGEIFGLLGPNGAGKSTTFKMMCGLLPITSGKAAVLGIDLKKNSVKARQHLGYMAQRFSLYDNLSVKQNLDFFSGIYGLSGAKQKSAVQRMIGAFDFEPVLNNMPAGLPLGFKQRLALACALMHNPEIIFLDEPTSGVDPVTRREFWIHINSLAEKGVTVMVTTHFMDEAEYCDRIGLISGGRLIALDTPDALKQSAADADNPTPTMEEAFIRLVLNAEKVQGSA